jgi:hypothetical protein
MLFAVGWKFGTDVAGQRTGPIFLDFKTLEDGRDMLSRNVCNYQPTPYNIQEDRKPQPHRGGSLK